MIRLAYDLFFHALTGRWPGGYERDEPAPTISDTQDDWYSQPRRTR